MQTFMHNAEFCRYRNRICVKSDGKFKLRLFKSDNLIDFLRPMRNGLQKKSLNIEAEKEGNPTSLNNLKPLLPEIPFCGVRNNIAEITLYPINGN